MKKDKSSLTDTSNNEYIHVSKIISLNIENEAYIAFCLKNNYKESLHSISYSVVQKDGCGNVLETAEFTYTDFIALPNKKFIPKVRIKRAYGCKSIELNLLNAKFEKNEYVDGRLNITEEVDILNEKNQAKKRKVLINKKVLYSCFAGIALAFCIFCFIVTSYLSARITLKANDTFSYQEYNGSATLVDYIKNDSNVTIPSVIDGYIVNSIDKEMFDGKRITSLNIEATSIAIPAEMFKDNTALVSVVANTLILNPGAFEGCTSLQSITANFSAIPQNCFSGCTSLKTIESNATIVETTAFRQCTSLEEVTLTNATILPGTFLDSPNIKTVSVNTIPSALAMTFNQLTEIDSLTINRGTIGDSFFIDIDVTNFHITDDVSIDTDLSKLGFENYTSNDSFEYLDNIIYNIKSTSNTLVIDTASFDIYYNAVRSKYITELTINSAFVITSDFMSKFNNLTTLNLLNDGITNTNYTFSNSYIQTINMHPCGNTLSSIIKNYKGNLNITSGTIKDNYFDGIDYDSIYINNNVSFSTNAFSGEFSIDKLVLESTTCISAATSISNVYELEVSNYNSAIAQTNDVKKVTLTGTYVPGSLATLKNILEVEITNINTNTTFGNLFNYEATYNNQNQYVPESLVTITVNALEIPNNYFYGCSNIANINFKNAISYGTNIISGCTGLMNIYMNVDNYRTGTNLLNSLNSLYLDHRLNLITNYHTLYNPGYNPAVDYRYSVTQNSRHEVVYDGNYYDWNGLFITDMHKLLGEEEDTEFNYSSMLNKYFTLSTTIFIYKRELVEIKYYDENIYTVTFYNDNYVVGSVDLGANDVLDFYDFNIEGLVGWYTDSNLRFKYGFNTTISSDLNLYAKKNTSSQYIKPNSFETLTLPSYSDVTIYNLDIELPLNAKVTLTFYPSNNLNVTHIRNSYSVRTYSSSSLASPITITFDYLTTDDVYFNIYGSQNSTFMYVCSVEYEKTTAKAASERTEYKYTCYTDESYLTLDLSSFTKEGYEFQGLFTEDGTLIVNSEGNSIYSWYNNLDNTYCLYAKYERILN